MGALLLPELKLIKKAFADCHQVNRCFDILGLGYPDWPVVDSTGADVGGKRKQGSTSRKDGYTSKRG